MPYPSFPEKVFGAFFVLGVADDWLFEIQKFPPKLLPTNMNVLQIQTALTFLSSQERFYPEDTETAVYDGTLLKLLLRLEDLLNAHQSKSQQWG